MVDECNFQAIFEEICVDFLVYSPNFRKHVKHLGIVFATMTFTDRNLPVKVIHDFSFKKSKTMNDIYRQIYFDKLKIKRNIYFLNKTIAVKS